MFGKLEREGKIRGRVLDVGCGTGENSLYLAVKGYSGLFHVFSDQERLLFVRSLKNAIRPGGLYHMLCFSDREPGDWGPRRVSRSEIRSSFQDDWRIRSVRRAWFDTNFDNHKSRAWLASIERKEE